MNLHSWGTLSIGANKVSELEGMHFLKFLLICHARSRVHTYDPAVDTFLAFPWAFLQVPVQIMHDPSLFQKLFAAIADINLIRPETGISFLSSPCHNPTAISAITSKS